MHWVLHCNGRRDRIPRGVQRGKLACRSQILKSFFNPSWDWDLEEMR